MRIQLKFPVESGFVQNTKIIKRRRAVRTVQWFYTGTKEPLFVPELGHVNNFRFIESAPGQHPTTLSILND